MSKTKMSRKQKATNLKEARKIFKPDMYEEFNNGYHWKFDLGNIRYNFYPTTYVWHSDVNQYGQCRKGQGIESFAKIINYPLAEKILKPKDNMARSENEHVQ